jgi:NADH-quinone oxidoreductase subunit N
MDLSAYKVITDTNQWLALWPEIYLGVLALLLLGVELLLPGRRNLSGRLAMIGSGALLAVLGWQAVTQGEVTSRLLFADMIAQDGDTVWLRLFFVACGWMVCHLASIFLRSRNLARVEYYHIVLIVTAGFMLLVQCRHFISFFVVLETVTIGFYILVAYARTSQSSLEAGLKYLVMGAFSSAILLFGIALLYGAAGNPILPSAAADPLQFGALAAFIADSSDVFQNREHILVLTGAILVLAGVAFKIGAVPFQMWVPDVYQGAPTPTTALLAVASKAAGFVVLYLLLTGPFAPLQDKLVPILTVITIATLLFGNLAALGQRNAKRLMGMSGIAHAGILLLGILAALTVDWGFQAVLFYLVVYAVASFAVFSVMAHVAPSDDADQDFDRFDALLQDKPLLGTVLVIGIGSLAGVPPLAGFVAKLLIFVAAFKAGLYGLLAVAVIGVVISMYYYFAWMRAAVMRNPFIEDADRTAVSDPVLSARIVLVGLTATTVLFGVWQGLFF